MQNKHNEKLNSQVNTFVIELGRRMQKCETEGDQICDEAKEVELEVKLVSYEMEVLKQVLMPLLNQSFLYKPN